MEPEPEPELSEGHPPVAIADAQALFDALIGEPFLFRQPYEILDSERERLRELSQAMARSSGATLRRVLESVQHLASGTDHVDHLRNLHYMCEAGTVQALVTLCDVQQRRGGDEALATKALACLSALGRHSMDRDALRWLMRLVVRADSDFTPDREQEQTSLLLLVLRQVVEKDGPATFVDLRDPLPARNRAAAIGGGASSEASEPGGVRMPPLSAPWPTDGYTLLLWMRLEEPAAASAEPRAIVRFCSKDGATGWSLRMVERRLQLWFTANTIGTRRTQIQTLELSHWTMPVGEWMHVAVMHRRHKLKKSTVSLYVNGDLKMPPGAGADPEDGGMPMPYPEVVAPITQCHIGNLETQNRWHVPLSFCGQLGPVFLCGGEGFDHVAKAVLLTELHAQGPDSFLWLDHAEARCDFTLPEESRRASKQLPLDVVHAFVPQAHLTMELEEDDILNRSASSSGAESGSDRIGSLRQSAVTIRASGNSLGGDSPLRPPGLVEQPHGLVGRACFLQSEGFKQSLACLGGPRLVIPFFGTHESEQDVSLLFRLLVELFQSDESIRQTMVSCQAFTMIAQLLGQSHLVRLGAKVVDSVSALAEALPVDSAVWADLQVHLVWHFPLWVYTPAECQMKLLELLAAWTADEQGQLRFRKLIGVQRILDMIRLCYWDQINTGIRMRMPEERKVPSSVLSIHLTGRAVKTSGKTNTRPVRAVLAQIRLRLLGLVENMVGSSLTFLEAKAMLAFAMECPDPIPVVEVTDMITRLYTSPATAQHMAAHLEKLGGVQLCLSGFDREHPVIDAAFMRLLTVIGTTIPSKKAKATPNIEALMLAATSQVEGRPQNEAAVDAMIQLLFNRVSSPAETIVDYDALATGRARHSRAFMTDRPAVQYPALLDCILRAASLSEDGVRKRVVLDLTPALIDDGFCALMNKSGWQQSLIEMACGPRPSSGSPADNQGVVATITAVANLFRKALLFCFEEEGGYKIWQETLVLIQQAAENDRMSFVHPFQQILYRGMLVELQSEIGTANVASEQDVDHMWVNVSHFLADEEDWYALGGSVGASVFATEADLLSCDFVDLYSGFLFAVADKFRGAISCLDLPCLSHGGQTLFDVLLLQMLKAFEKKPSIDMLMTIIPLFQLNLPQSACMTPRRLVFALVQLMDCLESASDDAELQDWNETLVHEISDVLLRRWDEFVDDSGVPLLGDQGAMMPDTSNVAGFCACIFGETWKPFLGPMRRLAQETKATGAFRTDERMDRIFGTAAVSALEEVVGKDRIEESSAADKLISASRGLMKQLDHDEMNRVTAELPRIHQRKSAKAHHALVSLLHQLCTGHGAFAPSDAAPEEADDSWKIDSTELNRGSRMRLRLERDPAGRTYRDAELGEEPLASSVRGAEDGWTQFGRSTVSQQQVEPEQAAVADDAPAALRPSPSLDDFCATFLREADKQKSRLPQQTAESDYPAGVGREVDEVWENQRSGFSSGFSAEHLLPVERGPWSDTRGAPQPANDEWECVDGWEWATEWMVEHAESVDPDGWAYAKSFPAPRGWGSLRSRFTLVRRRRWVRLRKVIGSVDDGAQLGTVRYSGRSSGRVARLSVDDLKSVLSDELTEESLESVLTLAAALDFDARMLRESLAAFDNDQEQTSTYLQELVEKQQRESACLERRGSASALPEPAALACLDETKSSLVVSLTQILHLQHGGSTDEETDASREAVKLQFGLGEEQIDECLTYMAHIFDHQQTDSAGTEQQQMSVDPPPAEEEEEQEEEEEWDSQVSNADLSVLQESRDDSQSYNEEVPEIVFGCQWITPSKEIMGSFSLTQAAMYFSPFDLNEHQEQRWPFSSLLLINRRRYLMQHTALEFFLADGTNAFLDFPVVGDNIKVSELIREKKPPNLDRKGSTFTSQDVERRARELCAQWEAGKLDNFNYLMALNTLAGRTYSDLTQYPVMPWVLTDYSSAVLDLTDPAVFRDLSKPMGALSPARLERFRNRADSLEDDSVPWFLFGTHYSTKAATLHYLVRLEPFTSMHVHMQSGKFDSPDRMFHSVPLAWESCSANENLSNVKELTPEWYYCPEMFRNDARLPLGTRSDGGALGDVVLPPWAETPEDFVRLHREALESPHVSSMLHNWVDLVFGFKQKGEEAKAADNVFFHLTYEGAVAVDSYGMDPIQQEAIKTQLSSFGQTPIQLFQKPHSQRKPHPTPPPFRPMTGDGQNLKLASRADPLPATVAIGVVSEKDADVLYTLHASTELRIVRVPVVTSSAAQKTGKKPQQVSVRRQQLPLRPGWVVPTPRAAAFAHDCQVLLLGCAWDCSLKIFRTADCELLSSVVYHRSAISCIGLSEREEVLLLGSNDTNVSVWRLRRERPVSSSALGPQSPRSSSSDRGSGLVADRPEWVFSEHSAEVTAVACNVDLDTIASASADATIVLHSLRSGNYLRTITHDQHSPAALQGPGSLFASVSFTELAVTAKNGCIISVFEGCYHGGATESELCLHSINGRLLNRVVVDAPLSQPVRLNGAAAGGGGALAWASERLTELMFTLEGSEVVLRDLHERPLHDLVRFQAQPGASGAVSGVSVALADGGQLYVGLSDGTVLRQKISGVIPRILRRKL